MQSLSDGDEEVDELQDSSVPPTPAPPLSVHRHERYRTDPHARTLMLDAVMYDSDTSPSRSEPQVGGGRRRRASSIPPGDYSTPTRLRTSLFPTPHAGETTQDAVVRRAQLAPPNPAAQRKPLPFPPVPHPSGPRAPSNPPRSRSGSFQPGLITYTTNRSRDAAPIDEEQASPQATSRSPNPGPMMDIDGLEGVASQLNIRSSFQEDDIFHLNEFYFDANVPTPSQSPHNARHMEVPTTIFTPSTPEIFNSPHSPLEGTPPPPGGTTPLLESTPPPPDSKVVSSNDAASPPYEEESEHPSALQKGGRISKVNHKLLEEGFEVIDEAYARLAEATGFTEDRVVALWNKHSHRGTRGYNPWNIYESYLAANLVEELVRAGFDVPVDIKWEEVTHAQRQLCYEAFQKEYPGDAWEEILHVFDLARKCEPTGSTFNKRTSVFNKLFSHLTRLSDMWQAKYNIETVFGMCGNVVNEDSPLVASYETLNAKEFFAVRCRAGDDEIRAHLKAHVYDKVSRTTTAQAWGDDINYETSSAKQQPSTTVKTDRPTAPKRPTAAYKSRGSTQDVNNLKQQIVDRAREAGFKIDTSLFPWKGLLELLARFGYYLMGWPFESRLPGEKGTEKGISGLRAQEQTAVFAALADVENPLTFVQYKGNPRDLTDGNVPVILGAPSETARGRRLFVNGVIDNEGVRHPGATEITQPSPSKPSHSSHPSSRSSSNPTKLSNSKKSRSRRHKVARVALSGGDESATEDLDMPPPPKRLKSIPEVVITSNKRRRPPITAQSSESEDDEPGTKMHKVTRQVSRVPKTVTFASLDEDDANDMSAYEGSSSVGQGSPSPPQTRMKNRQKEKDMAKAKAKTKALPEDLPAPSDQTAGGSRASGGSSQVSMLRSAGTSSGGFAGGSSTAGGSRGDGGDGSMGRASRRGLAKSLVGEPRGSKDASRGSGGNDVTGGASRGGSVKSLAGQSEGMTDASRGLGGPSRASEGVSVTAPTASYPPPRPAYRGTTKRPHAGDGLLDANFPKKPRTTSAQSVHPPPGSTAGAASPGTSPEGRVLSPAPASTPTLAQHTSGAHPHGPPLHQSGGGAPYLSEEAAVIPLDEGLRAPNPAYGYPPGNMYYPPYAPGPPAVGNPGSSAGQAPPYPYPYYHPYAPPGAHQGQPYWQPPPQGFPYGQFAPPGPYPMVPQPSTNEGNAVHTQSLPHSLAQNPPADPLELPLGGPK